MKKDLGVGFTYLIEGNRGDSPKLMAKRLSDGRDSLYLEYYFSSANVIDEEQGKRVKKIARKKETLSLYLMTAPRTPAERQYNKDVLEVAKKIRFERGQEQLKEQEGYRIKRKQDINFLDYFQAYIDDYKKKDLRNLKLALQRFKDFLSDTPKYQIYKLRITPKQITRDVIVDFVEYLKSRSVGEGADTLYSRFKKVVKYATEHDVFTKNPCTGISIKVDGGGLKDILSPDEIRQLIATHYEFESANIRNAFLFCLNTGLRFCDVKDLTYSNVDFGNRLLTFEQNKTRGHSSNSKVTIPLKDLHFELIGEPETPQDRGESIFKLPSYEACLKALKRWVARAGIQKHISWHCARHSFAVMVLNSGANIKTVGALMGHSTLRYTERYTRAIDSLKEDAINAMPDFEL